jgi:hypothetical protein
MDDVDTAALNFAIRFALSEIERDLEIPAIPGRHLVLDSDREAATRREIHVMVACGDVYVPYVRTAHTFLARSATCPECRAVQEARCAVLNAES